MASPYVAAALYIMQQNYNGISPTPLQVRKAFIDLATTSSFQCDGDGNGYLVTGFLPEIKLTQIDHDMVPRNGKATVR